MTTRSFGRGLLPVPSISVPFLMTRIPSSGELMVFSKNLEPMRRGSFPRVPTEIEETLPFADIIRTFGSDPIRSYFLVGQLANGKGLARQRTM
jgi:hypothetical protein